MVVKISSLEKCLFTPSQGSGSLMRDSMTLCSFSGVLLLTINAVYPVSQPPNPKPTLDLLTPNKVDYVASANQIFSVHLCLFLILYPMKVFCIVLFVFCSSEKEDYLLHEVLKLICITSMVFFNYFFIRKRPFILIQYFKYIISFVMG